MGFADCIRDAGGAPIVIFALASGEGADDHGHGAAPRETIPSVSRANLRWLAALIGIPVATPCGTSHRTGLPAHRYYGRDLEAWAPWCSRLGVHRHPGPMTLGSR